MTCHSRNHNIQLWRCHCHTHLPQMHLCDTISMISRWLGPSLNKASEKKDQSSLILARSHIITLDMRLTRIAPRVQCGEYKKAYIWSLNRDLDYDTVAYHRSLQRRHHCRPWFLCKSLVRLRLKTKSKGKGVRAWRWKQDVSYFPHSYSHRLITSTVVLWCDYRLNIALYSFIMFN